ncbi:MFS transporter [Solirubrobacter ginsenosidimutans]|uniref:MFS transporter n=1 Tax=Solirubrobacter ginsenosidimutans TaxID=490573 RepID=A0A9X3S2Z1_9ACTN|nr:MFS transporter [Solirubrobacter ginsenosidimutans]MDA0159118.1 MFS transporter [Solirubrobacter ginsenosidimutans]
MNEHSGRQHHNVTLAILAIGALAFALAQTTVIPALTAMQHAFGVSTSDITWMVSGYFLAASIATPVLGRLGDMFGKERFLAISLGAFAIGSFVSAMSNSLGLMIVGRVLQGIGGGVFPLSFGIVRDEFPLAKVPTGIAMLGATAGIGAAIGLPLGGLLVDQASYHWIFWVSGAMGAIATITTIRYVPESPVRTPGRVDFIGALILAVGLSAVLIAVSQANQWGWGSDKTLGLVGIGVAILVAFVAFERRTPSPLVNMRTLARPPVLITDIATLLVGFGLFGVYVLIPQIAELAKGGDVGLGLNATEAGLLMAPGGLMMIIAAPIVGRVSERIGSKLPLAIGSFLASGALLGLALAHDSALLIVLWGAILNTGIGCAFAALPNLIIGAVDPSETGEATGVNTIARNVGAALGGQVAASIVAGQVTASGAPGNRGFELAFLMSAGVALLAGIFGLLIPVKRIERASTRPLAVAEH